MNAERRPWPLHPERFETALTEARRASGQSLGSAAWRSLRSNRPAWWSLVFLMVVTGLSLAAPLLPVPSPVAMNLELGAQAPTWPWLAWGESEFEREYWDLNPLDELLVDLREATFERWQTGPWLGTDSKGRDTLSRILWGSRTSLLVGLAATLTSLVIGVTYGALAGLLGGRVDQWMMRLVDVLYSIPFIFVVIFVLSLLNAPRDDLAGDPLIDREQVFFVVIGAIYWLTMARVVRGQVLSLKNREFIAAARAAGAGTLRVLFGHLVPNVLSIAIVYLTLTIPAVLLFEAFLSFLGLGIAPPRVSWGLLAVDGTDSLNPLKSFWWLIVWPALAMGSTLMALNFVGDGLRDALDPRRPSGTGRGTSRGLS